MLCRSACDGCGKCAADATKGLIEMVDNLPQIYHDRGIPENARATWRCPTGAIQWLDGSQFVPGRERDNEGQRRYAQLH